MFTSCLFNLPQNGFVECEKDSCPATDDCYAIQKNSESCCDKCKGNENIFQFKVQHIKSLIHPSIQNVSIKEKSIKAEPNGLMKMIHVVFLSVSPVSLQSL